MYYPIFLAIFLALSCPTGNTRSVTTHSNTVNTIPTDTTGVGGSGGDNGHVHPH